MGIVHVHFLNGAILGDVYVSLGHLDTLIQVDLVIPVKRDLPEGCLTISALVLLATLSCTYPEHIPDMSWTCPWCYDSGLYTPVSREMGHLWWVVCHESLCPGACELREITAAMLPLDMVGAKYFTKIRTIPRCRSHVTISIKTVLTPTMASQLDLEISQT